MVGNIKKLYELNYGNLEKRLKDEGRKYKGLGKKDSVVIEGRLKVG